jgi:hypothetical protein
LEDGGETIEDNLVLLCSRHHHLIHGKGWAINKDAARVITVATPYGQSPLRQSS